MEHPKLIEPHTKGYLEQSLKHCHTNRVSTYYYVLNTSVFMIFVGITGALLYFCNKNKLTPYEKDEKMLKDQQYIMSKIRYYKEEVKNAKDSFFSAIRELPAPK
jgi:hypothetical protein